MRLRKAKSGTQPEKPVSTDVVVAKKVIKEYKSLNKKVLVKVEPVTDGVVYEMYSGQIHMCNLPYQWDHPVGSVFACGECRRKWVVTYNYNREWSRLRMWRFMTFVKYHWMRRQ